MRNMALIVDTSHLGRIVVWKCSNKSQI